MDISSANTKIDIRPALRADLEELLAMVQALAAQHGDGANLTRDALREAELVDVFRSKGLQIVAVNRQSFVDAVLKNKPVESLGYERKDYDRIVGIK